MQEFEEKVIFVKYIPFILLSERKRLRAVKFVRPIFRQTKLIQRN